MAGTEIRAARKTRIAITRHAAITTNVPRQPGGFAGEHGNHSGAADGDQQDEQDDDRDDAEDDAGGDGQDDFHSDVTGVAALFGLEQCPQPAPSLHGADFFERHLRDDEVIGHYLDRRQHNDQHKEDEEQ